MTYPRQSKWEYNTGASLAVSIGSFVAAGGILVFDDPSGAHHKFRFGSLGMGLGMRLPKSLRLPDVPLPRSQGASPSGATTDFWAQGSVFLNRSFHGGDLRIDDFAGGALIAEFCGGVLIAKSFTYMLVGIPPAVLSSAAFHPAFVRLATYSARALVRIKGISEGLIDGFNGTSSIGLLSYEGIYSKE
jgi:hypothetical protein